jgi:hypothetical protein
MIRKLVCGLGIALALSAPAAAQTPADVVHSVFFDGISFQYNAVLGPNINITAYPGDPPVLEQPGGPMPPHTRFQVYNAFDPSLEYTAPLTISVFKTDTFFDYPAYQAELDRLRTLTASETDLTPFMQIDVDGPYNPLPFLPVYPAGQAIRARATFINTDELLGIAYLTVFRQDVSPFLASEFLYTYQGTTPNGGVYVSAIMPVVAPGFPSELTNFDYETFAAGFQQYIDDSVAALGAADPASFTPNLLDLVEVVGTIAIAESP